MTEGNSQNWQIHDFNANILCGAYDPNTASHGYRSSGDRNRDDRGGRILKNEEGTGSGRRWDLDGSEKEDSPKETARMLNRDLDRERDVVEAKMWSGGEFARKKKTKCPRKFR
ncbi:hypothetical protein Q3G72_004348 [Acer saccharum]|nr:hypothetical protein Q3G72_004348 [Acer saccharum]